MVVLTPRQYGIAVIIFGVVIVSPDSTFLRLLERYGVSTLIMIMWKSISKVVFITPFVLITYGFEKTINSFLLGPYYLILGSVLQAIMEFCFTTMFLTTTVARALLFYSLNPMWSALMGKVFLGDTIPFHTKVTLIFALLSVLLTFGGQLIGNNQPEGRASTLGDLIAVCTGLSTSAYITTTRAAERKNPNICMTVSTIGGGILSFTVLGIILLSQNMSFLPQPDDGDKRLPEVFALLLVDGLCVSTILVCMTVGARYVSGAETSLVLLLEGIMGPLLVFIVFKETPGVWTLSGGALLLVSLFFHEYYAMKYVVTGDDGGNKVAPAAPTYEEGESSPSRRSIDLHPPGSIEGTLATLENKRALYKESLKLSEEEREAQKQKQLKQQEEDLKALSIHDHPRGSIDMKSPLAQLEKRKEKRRQEEREREKLEKEEMERKSINYHPHGSIDMNSPLAQLEKLREKHMREYYDTPSPKKVDTTKNIDFPEIKNGLSGGVVLPRLSANKVGPTIPSQLSPVESEKDYSPV